VPLREPLLSFWLAYESLGSSVAQTPWGVVATDARYPRIYDANHAGVVGPSPHLTLGDIRDVLEPALDRVGCPYEHIEFLDTRDDCPAYRELREALPDTTADAMMFFEGQSVPTPQTDGVSLEEVARPGEEFWSVYRDSRVEFGEDMEGAVLDQLVERDRRVFVPAGLRIFAATGDGRTVGFASLISLAGVGYVDNVVTLSEYRRRGVASAAVCMAVRASRDAGDRMTFLFAEDGGGPQRLYERLGFRTRQKAIGFTRARQVKRLTLV